MKSPLIKPLSDDSITYTMNLPPSSPTLNSHPQFPILSPKPSRNDSSSNPFQINFTQHNFKKSTSSYSLSNEISAMNVTSPRPVSGKIKTEKPKKTLPEVSPVPNLEKISIPSAHFKILHSKKLSQSFFDSEIDDFPILAPPRSSTSSKERAQSDYYTCSTVRNKPKGPRILDQPTKKELPPPPLPPKDRAQSLHIPTKNFSNFYSSVKPLGPRSYNSTSKKNTLDPNSLPQIPVGITKLSINDFSNLREAKLGFVTRSSEFQLKKKESVISSKTVRQSYHPGSYKKPDTFPVVDAREALSTHFFENQATSITNEEEDVLRRFFDLAPPPPPKNQMVLSARTKMEVQRSQSEDTSRLHKKYPRRASLKPPCSVSARQKNLTRNRSSEIAERTSFQSLSPRTNSVTGLFNLVKTHATSKTPPMFGEGGVADPQLNKLLTKLVFNEHVSQLELQDLLFTAPWLIKLCKITPEANTKYPTLEALSDSLPSSKNSTPNNERVESDEMEKNSEDLKMVFDKFKKKRCYLIRELAETESNYLTHLITTLKLFKVPIEFVENILIPTKVIDVIFGNINKLIGLSSEITACLEALTDENFETNCVGSIFLTQYSNFTNYLDYIQGYRAALKLIEKWENSSAYFKDILNKGAQENPARQTLKEMLILPVQRLTRYSLLLRSLLSCTPNDHLDYKPLETALKQMSLLAVEANDLQRDEEEATAAQAIFDSINNCPPLLREIGLKRAFISEAQELKMRRRICMFIYADSIMITSARKNWSLGAPNASTNSLTRSPKWKFIQYLPLSRLDLVEIIDSENSTELSLLIIQPEPTSDDKQQQVSDVVRYYFIQHLDRRCHMEFLHIIKTHLRKVTGSSSQSLSSDSTVYDKSCLNSTRYVNKSTRPPLPKLPITSPGSPIIFK